MYQLYNQLPGCSYEIRLLIYYFRNLKNVYVHIALAKFAVRLDFLIFEFKVVMLTSLDDLDCHLVPN
jgi:hypothetical protein